MNETHSARFNRNETVSCSCGWSSGYTDTVSEAINRFADHAVIQALLR